MPIIEEIQEVEVEVLPPAAPIATQLPPEPPQLEKDSNKAVEDEVDDVEEKERKVLIEIVDNKGMEYALTSLEHLIIWHRLEKFC